MTNKIKIKRGLKIDLPVLENGEMGLCTDTGELFIGSSDRNILISNASNILPEIYKTEPIGELFTPPAVYNAWCPTNLQYDKTRKRFVVLINGADSHVYNTCPQYFVEIDPETLVATKPRKISPVDSQGNPITFGIEGAATAFAILDDGSYMYIRRTVDAMTYTRIISTDGGNTWVVQENITVNPAFTTAFTIWAIKKLSSGRLIASLGGHANSKAKIMISDDNGVNWNVVNVGTTYISGNLSEPCIIEVLPNTLIAIARRTTSGSAAGSEPEAAAIAFSNNNGLTWTDYVSSTSIINMNAASASAYVHDGIIEVFAASRFYSTTANTETGETGAVFQYVATIEDALLDKFTLKGVVSYANAANSVDIHSPCVAIDDKQRLLLMYMDESLSPKANVNYWFARGNLGSVRYNALDGSNSAIFQYSGKHIDLLFSKLKTDLASIQYETHQLSKGLTSNIAPSNSTLIWTKIYNAQNKKILLANDQAFTSNVSFANLAPEYNALRVDSNNITYNYQGNNWAVAIVASKPNFAIAYKGSIANNSIGIPVAASIINGIGYGIYRIGSSYGLPSNKVYDFRFEYWDGKMKAFIDDDEVDVQTFPIENSENFALYSQLMNVIGTLDSTKKYAIHGGANGGNIYDVRFGEWES